VNVDYFDLYHAVVKSLPWPEEAQKWADGKPSHQHALDALRKIGAQGVSSVDKLDPLIERILKAMHEAPHSVTRAGVPEAKMETPHKPMPVWTPEHKAELAKPDDKDDDEPKGKHLPDPKHSKAHH